jgi:Ser/Thr protein kinase RdoA (MazF antagonist)
MNNFQKRINYQGDLVPFLDKVCKDFNIGSYLRHEVVAVGYEDFNLFLTTDNNKYFVKIFSSFRDITECKRYVEIMDKIVSAGVSHPSLYKSNQGYLYEIENDGLIDRLVIMQFINGSNFYDMHRLPDDKEMRFIIEQAALINKINVRPTPIYDYWAVTSLSQEYKEKNRYLNVEDKKTIEPLISKFNSLSLDRLPHCFVHGDITKTNTLKSKTGNIYLIDFAVANYYPRIQELAVILCDLFFDPSNPSMFYNSYKLALSEYQKYIELSSEEIQILPTYVKFAHTMHVLLANYEKVVKGNTSEENEYFLNIGRKGLNFTSNFWA